MDFETFTFFALTSAVSISYAALGVALTERAGVLNLTVEGLMAITAYYAFLGSQNGTATGILYSIAIAATVGTVYSVLVIKLGRDQVLTGLLIWFILIAIANYKGTEFVGKSVKKLKPDILMYLLPIVAYGLWFLIHKTTPGLNMRAISEAPDVAHSVGVRVNTIRYLATVGGFALVGLAGAHLVLALTPVWGYNIVGGRGWIAYALALVANRKPKGIVFLGIVFSVTFLAQFALKTGVSPHLLSMIPYACAFLIAVTFTSTEPKALGKPWRNNK